MLYGQFLKNLIDLKVKILMLFGDTKKLSDKELEDFRIDLSCSVKMDKRKPIFLLKHNSGIGHSEWNDDLSQFIRWSKAYK